MFKVSVCLVPKLNQVDLFLWCTNPANEDCAKFCVEEVFKCKERRMIWEDRGWTKSQDWRCPYRPQEISMKYTHQILGIPKASPSSSTILSGHLSRHCIFIASHTMCYSWSIILFWFQFCFVCLLVINGWILAFLFGDKHTPFYCLEHSSFHFYCFVSVQFLLLLFLALVFHSYFVQCLLV